MNGSIIVLILCVTILISIGIWVFMIIKIIKTRNKEKKQEIADRKRMGKPTDTFNGLYVTGLKEINCNWEKFIWEGKYYLGHYNEYSTYDNELFMIEITKEQYDANE